MNRRTKNAAGEREVDFLNITAWRQLAELCAKCLIKGSKVAVSGSVQSRQYEAKDGSKRTVYEVIASEVEFLTPKSQAKEQTEPESFTEVDDADCPF